MAQADSNDAAPWTVLRILRWTQGYFADKNIEDARRDAELLLGHTLGLNRVQLFTQFDRPLTNEERDAFRAVVKRRANREPVAYILGTREFWSMELRVDRRALIPRPDTECLVEQIRQRAWELVDDPRRRPRHTHEADPDPHQPIDTSDLDDHQPHDDDTDASPSAEPVEVAPPTPAAPALPWAAPRRLRIADIGTGTGAIALALARELSYADLLATDISQDALDLAAHNAAALRLDTRVRFARGDLLDPLRDGAPWDIIASNPPYIPEGQLHDLMPEVAAHEPRIALTPGPRGTEALERLARDAFPLLQPGGWLLVEIGFDQADAARRILDEAPWPWADVRVYRDPYSGQHRVIEARVPPSP